MRLTLCTAPTPGAVAILQMHGEGVKDVLTALTGREHWHLRRASLCGFAGIDEGLAVLMREDTAQLMPHGGPRVVQRMIEHLTAQFGCTYDAAPHPQSLYPEARSAIEADMLDAIARAASPAAIDLLASQPAAWSALLCEPLQQTPDALQAILERSHILDRLIAPPTVVVIGPPNAGKSTLTNALMGQAVSIVADLPGTTRDWVGGLVELDAWGDPARAVAVHWLDTPGLRDSDDPIEQRAIALAGQQIERADVLIAMRAGKQDWPLARTLRRTPDLWLVNKVDDADEVADDDAGLTPDLPLPISAMHGHGLQALQHRVIHSLGLAEPSHGELWAFSQTLRKAIAHNDVAAACAYIQGQQKKIDQK